MSKLPIRPEGNKILVKLLEQEEEKVGGIIIPDLVNVVLRKGKVVRASLDWEKHFPAGTEVYFPEKKGTGWVYGGEQYVYLDCNPDKEEIWSTDENTLPKK